MSLPQTYTVPDTIRRERADKVLAAAFPELSRVAWQRSFDAGLVRRAGIVLDKKHDLHAGEVIEFAHADVVPSELHASGTRLDILFEDAHMLAVNKPAGMAVHGGSGLSYGVIEGLRALRPQAKFLELVHRLDRETSGCLLIAKKRSALRHLHELFREGHQVKKIYVALLAGVWERKSLLVDAPLKKNILQSGERIVKVARDGKPAQTELRRLRKFANATLVEASLMTGRTHQIRVHALSIGYPIAGDERYGHEAANAEFRQTGLKRLFLHAAELAFAHPRGGHPFQIKAPLEPELQEFLDRLSP